MHLCARSVARGRNEQVQSCSLSFHNENTEAGFVKSLADRMLSGAAWNSAAVLGVNGFVVLSATSVALGTSMPHPSYLYTIYSSVIMWLLAFVVFVIAMTQRLHKHIGFVQREYLLLAVNSFWIFQLIFTRHWYIVQVMGVEGMWELDSELCRHGSTIGTGGCRIVGGEADLVLELAIFLFAAHFTLAIRWRVLFVLEISTVSLYAIAVSLFQSGQDNAGFLLCLLVVLAVLAGLGKRQLEKAERRVFLQLVSERQMRAEAEFQLEVTVGGGPFGAPTPEDAGSVVASAVTTSVAGKIFSQPEHNMESLAEIGRREQWLVDAADLSMDSGGLLGKGGFGIVASGRFLRTPVAVKLAKQGRSDHVSLVDIGNELRVLRKLRHPNIVLCHGACIDADHLDIVVILERVVGQIMDLYVHEYHAVAKHTPHRVHGAFMVLLGVCRALVYLHARRPPIVHGDLKGSNIFVESRGTGPHAKVLDFGLSRVLSRQVQPLGGTHRWKAPEVFDQRTPTASADVFSFGRVIYFALVGKQPLQDVDRKEILRAAKNKVEIALEWPEEPTAEVTWCRPVVAETGLLNPVIRPTSGRICRHLENAVASLEVAMDNRKSPVIPVLPRVDTSCNDETSEPAWMAAGGKGSSPQCTVDVSGFWGSVRQLRQEMGSRDFPQQAVEHHREFHQEAVEHHREFHQEEVVDFVCEQQEKEEEEGETSASQWIQKGGRQKLEHL